MKTKNTIYIKKYENRRLYNINEKKYISLEDVRKYVNEGYDVEITEKKTGKDITRQVLLQVILDMSPEKLNAFPILFLKFLIKSDAYMLNDYFKNFFTDQLGLYLNNRDAYLSAMNNMKSNFFNGFSNNDVFKNAFSNFFSGGFNPFGNKKDNTENKTEDKTEDNNKNETPDKSENNNDIDDLKKMMAAMAQKISDLEKNRWMLELIDIIPKIIKN